MKTIEPNFFAMSFISISIRDNHLLVYFRYPFYNPSSSCNQFYLFYWNIGEYSHSNNFFVYRNLAIGIGIQNFPEGLAVSLPLHASGFSIWKSLW